MVKSTCAKLHAIIIILLKRPILNRTNCLFAPEIIIPRAGACPQTRRKNDIESSNPNGKDSVDGNNNRNKLLNYKQISMIGTHNVRTLRKDTKRSELVENFNRCKLSVLSSSITR